MIAALLIILSTVYEKGAGIQYETKDIEVKPSLLYLIYKFIVLKPYHKIVLFLEEKTAETQAPKKTDKEKTTDKQKATKKQERTNKIRQEATSTSTLKVNFLTNLSDLTNEEVKRKFNQAHKASNHHSKPSSKKIDTKRANDTRYMLLGTELKQRGFHIYKKRDEISINKKKHKALEDAGFKYLLLDDLKSPHE